MKFYLQDLINPQALYIVHVQQKELAQCCVQRRKLCDELRLERIKFIKLPYGWFLETTDFYFDETSLFLLRAKTKKLT